MIWLEGSAPHFLVSRRQSAKFRTITRARSHIYIQTSIQISIQNIHPGLSLACAYYTHTAATSTCDSIGGPRADRERPNFYEWSRACRVCGRRIRISLAGLVFSNTSNARRSPHVGRVLCPTIAAAANQRFLLVSHTFPIVNSLILDLLMSVLFEGIL